MSYPIFSLGAVLGMLNMAAMDYEQEGDAYQRQGNWKECGRSMLAAAETLPQHTRHAQRLAKAAHCFQEARMVGQAMKVRITLVSAHPSDPLAPDALFDVAEGYRQLAYYTKAAVCYEAFAATFPHDKRAARALAYANELGEAVRDERNKCIPELDLSAVGGSRRSRDR